MESVRKMNAVVVDRICDVCEDGRMRPTRATLLTYPPKYHHVCDNCGAEAIYDTIYPHINYEEDLGDIMNEPDTTGYQSEIRTIGTEKWVICPHCGKKQFPLTAGAIIRGQQFQCKRSSCKQTFEVNT